MPRNEWSLEEIELLKKLKRERRIFRTIAQSFPRRSERECYLKWRELGRQKAKAQSSQSLPDLYAAMSAFRKSGFPITKREADDDVDASNGHGSDGVTQINPYQNHHGHHARGMPDLLERMTDSKDDNDSYLDDFIVDDDPRAESPTSHSTWPEGDEIAPPIRPMGRQARSKAADSSMLAGQHAQQQRQPANLSLSRASQAQAQSTPGSFANKPSQEPLAPPLSLTLGQAGRRPPLGATVSQKQSPLSSFGLFGPLAATNGPLTPFNQPPQQPQSPSSGLFVRQSKQIPEPSEPGVHVNRSITAVPSHSSLPRANAEPRILDLANRPSDTDDDEERREKQELEARQAKLKSLRKAVWKKRRQEALRQANEEIEILEQELASGPGVEHGSGS